MKQYLKAIFASLLIVIPGHILWIFDQGIEGVFFLTLLTLPFICIIFFENWVWNKLYKFLPKLIFVFVPYLICILFYMFILGLNLSGWEGLGIAIILMIILTLMVCSHSFFILTIIIEKIVAKIKNK